MIWNLFNDFRRLRIRSCLPMHFVDEIWLERLQLSDMRQGFGWHRADVWSRGLQKGPEINYLLDLTRHLRPRDFNNQMIGHHLQLAMHRILAVEQSPPESKSQSPDGTWMTRSRCRPSFLWPRNVFDQRWWRWSGLPHSEWWKREEGLGSEVSKGLPWPCPRGRSGHETGRLGKNPPFFFANGHFGLLFEVYPPSLGPEPTGKTKENPLPSWLDCAASGLYLQSCFV